MSQSNWPLWWCHILGCLVLMSLGMLAVAAGQDKPLTAEATWEVVRGNCSPCHSIRLVTQQRLDRANWEWVMEDMVKKYGATWISKDLQKIIIDYLVKHYGPDQ